MNIRKSLKLFEQIYNETYNNTLKYIVCKCNSLNDVDDIIQDTYLEFFRVIKNGKEINDKKAYIITIARSKIIEHYKNNEKIKTFSIFQNKDDEENTIDLDARHRYRIRFYY